MNSYIPYPTKTVTPLDRQGPRNLTARLLCRLVQLGTKQKSEICSIASKNLITVPTEAYHGDIMYH